MLVTVRLNGCDDSTIFDMEMTKEEYNFLYNIAKRSKETSEYGCMPIMDLEIKTKN